MFNVCMVCSQELSRNLSETWTVDLERTESTQQKSS